MRRIPWPTALLACLAGCGPMTGPGMGTAVYRGAGLDGVGRWRPWGKGYCAFYPQIGGGPALGQLVAGPVEPDGYRCYEVRAAAGYHALFRPDGIYVGALVP